MSDTITPYMGLTQPEPGADPGTWGTPLNADMDLIDSHDHSAGKGTPVTTAGIDINADLDFGNNAALNMAGLAMEPGQSIAAYSLWVNLVTGELYFTDGVGNHVKMTAAGQINISVVGGIVGDYASVSAALFYDDSNKTYRMLQAAPLPNLWASVSAGNVNLYEKASGITHFTRLASHASLAASYTLTMPAALPGSNSLTVTSSAGAQSFTRDPSVDTITTTGDATIGGNAAVTGDSTAAAHKLAAAQPIIIPPSAATLAAGHAYATTDNSAVTLGTSADPLVFPVIVHAGQKIVSVTAWVDKTTNGSHSITVGLYKYTPATNTTTQVVTGTLASNNPGRVSFSTTTPAETAVAGTAYTVQVMGSGTTGDLAYHTEVGVDSL